MHTIPVTANEEKWYIRTDELESGIDGLKMQLIRAKDNMIFHFKTPCQEGIAERICDQARRDPRSFRQGIQSLIAGLEKQGMFKVHRSGPSTLSR